MIKEVLAYLLTPSSREARDFGHLYESIALLQREKRCATQWLPHRQHCKSAILKYSSLLEEPKNKKVLVLGSGHLHEIPLKELSERFSQVDLVDIVHLKETKKKFTDLGNINFIETDITGLEKEIRQTKRPCNRVPEIFLDQHYDLIISANLLSQLSYHLKNYLQKKTDLSLGELEKFCFQVSSDHYTYLKKFKAPVILITDIETQFVGDQNEVLDIETPYINFELPKPQQVWSWDVAPRPEFSKDYSLRMQVAVFILNFKASQT